MAEIDFANIRLNGQLPLAQLINVAEIVDDLWEPYIDSTISMLSDLEAAALSLEAGTNIEENAASIRRILHSIKGESGMTGVMDVYSLIHEVESAFDEIDDRSNAADLVLRTKDWIEEAVKGTSKYDFVQARVVQEEEQQIVEENKSRIKTLIIEDDSLCKKRLLMLIEDFCDCTHAENGQKGFELFCEAMEQGKPYEMVTLDIQMPIMDGHETLKAIRDYEIRNNIYGLDGVKIIMTTSQEETEHVFGAFREGCEAYVIKHKLSDKILEEIAKLGLLQAHVSYSL